MKGIEKFEKVQNKRSDKIEDKDKLIPDTGAVEKKVRVAVFCAQGKNDCLSV